MKKKIIIISGCMIFVILGIAVALLFNVGGINDEGESPGLTIGGYYPYTYSGVIKEIIDDDTVVIEQTSLGDSIGGIIEVDYEHLECFRMKDKKVTLSVGDEVWFSLWSSSDLTEKDGKRHIKTDELSVNEGGRLSYGFVKEIIDENTQLVTEFPEENPEIGEEFIIHFDKYELWVKENEFIEIVPEVGDFVDITYNENDVDKSGEKLTVECVRVIATAREDIGPEDILFIKQYMWLEGEVVELVNDNTMIVKASSENEHISKGDKVEVKYKFALEEKIEVVQSVCVGDKVSVCYNSYDVENVDEDKLTSLRVEILNDYKYMDGYVLGQKDENSVIVWVEEYDAILGGYYVVAEYDEYYKTVIKTGENQDYYSYEDTYEADYEMNVSKPKEEACVRILFNGNSDNKVIKSVKCEMITEIEWE